MKTPELSVVIPTYNRARHLERILRALQVQSIDRARFEVVVVDDGSDDGTSDVLARAYPYSIVSCAQKNAGPAAARNCAIRMARGRLIVFLDDDVIPEPDLLERHALAQNITNGVVIGRMSPPQGLKQCAWADWELRALDRQYTEMAAGRWDATARQFYTANASVPREALLQAGLFDERFRRAEDIELGYRLDDLGLPFRFEPDAVVTHDTPRTLQSWLKTADAYGEYAVVMWRELGREHILWSMAREINIERNAVLRAMGRWFVGRRSAMFAVRRLAPASIHAASRWAPRRVALALCSVVFNLLYWDAAAKALGGRSAFWETIDLHVPSKPTAPLGART